MVEHMFRLNMSWTYVSGGGGGGGGGEGRVQLCDVIWQSIADLVLNNAHHIWIWTNHDSKYKA